MEKQTDKRPGVYARRRAHFALIFFALLAVGLFAWNPDNLYLWIKALHIIAVISWMAGLFYMPRLFIYHTDAEPGSAQSETFKVMERRLLKAIINPAMAVTWIVGLYLAWAGHWFSAGWFHGKFALVLAMSAVHGILTARVREFAEDRNSKSTKYFRIINEVPTVLMILIVILVIVKPF